MQLVVAEAGLQPGLSVSVFYLRKLPKLGQRDKLSSQGYKGWDLGIWSHGCRNSIKSGERKAWLGQNTSHNLRLYT